MLKSVVLLTACVLGGALVTAYYYERQHKYSDQFTKTKRRDKKEIPRNKTIEACVSDIESVIIAVEGGFTSLELCSSRLEGGVTPSFGFVREVVKYCHTKSVEVHVLVRPQPGGFVYSSKEFDIILQDTAALIDLGVDGIVCGILTEFGDVDVPRMQSLRNLCSDHISLTFHRAFDICNNWQTAMEAIFALRCDRLLTSGRAKTAPAGAAFLAQLQKTHGHQITIVAAAGVKSENIAALLSETKVSAVHIGSGIDETIHDNISDSIDQSAFQDMVMRTGANKQKVARMMGIIWHTWNLPLEIENDES